MKAFTLLLLINLISIAKADDTPKQWPSVAFKYVVAYCYDFSQDERGGSITFPDGSLHKGVIRATTVRLNDVKVTKLKTLLSADSKKEHGDVDCYEPHHAFVFYDEDWKVVASIDICLLCDDYVARPKGVSETIDLEAMELFCREVGLPIFQDPKSYAALYKQEQSTGDPKPKSSDSDFVPLVPGEVDDSDSDPFAPVPKK